MRQKGWKNMRPELTVLNARLAKARREAARAKADREKSFRQGYAIADGQYGKSPATILKGEVRVDADYVDFSIMCADCGTDKTVRLTIKKTAVFMDVEKAMSQAIEAWNKRAEREEE